MRLHGAGLQAICTMCCFGLLVFTGHVYYLLGYSMLITVLLLRHPKRVPSLTHFPAPISGLVEEIRYAELGGKKMQVVTVQTWPILHVQTFAGSSQIVTAKQVNSSFYVEYQHFTVEYTPRFGTLFCTGPDLSSTLGYSVFGCTTKVYLPSNLKLAVTEGQTLVDSETILAEAQ